MLDILSFLFPEPFVMAVVTPLTIICIFIFLFISGKLKISFNVKTNYTRKLFHISVFTLAGAVGYLWDFRAVMLYGGITGLIIIYVLYLGEGHILFEGIGREQDAPHRRLYVGVPFITTAIAGLFNNCLFLEFALVGYLVAGWGDAVGEPIGVRFGKHRYKVPSLRNVPCERSLEGSLAIMVVSAIAVAVALAMITNIAWPFVIAVSVLAGLVTAFVEAYSPHGLDNFTTQVVSAALCYGVINIFL